MIFGILYTLYSLPILSSPVSNSTGSWVCAVVNIICPAAACCLTFWRLHFSTDLMILHQSLSSGFAFRVRDPVLLEQFSSGQETTANLENLFRNQCSLCLPKIVQYADESLSFLRCRLQLLA